MILFKEFILNELGMIFRYDKYLYMYIENIFNKNLIILALKIYIFIFKLQLQLK